MYKGFYPSIVQTKVSVQQRPQPLNYTHKGLNKGLTQRPNSSIFYAKRITPSIVCNPSIVCTNAICIHGGLDPSIVYTPYTELQSLHTFCSSVQRASRLGMVKGVVPHHWENGWVVQIPHPGEAKRVYNQIHSQLTHIANRDAGLKKGLGAWPKGLWAWLEENTHNNTVTGHIHTKTLTRRTLYPSNDGGAALLVELLTNMSNWALHFDPKDHGVHHLE